MARKEQESWEFIVRGSGDIRLVRNPRIPQVNPATGAVSYTQGVTIESKGGRIVTRDPELAEWLRAHHRCNEWYVELGNEPGRPKPETEDVIAELTEAVIAADVKKIVELRQRELATHNRAAVLVPTVSALEKLEEAGVKEAGEALKAEEEPEPAAA
jgi:hypothetical protein